MVRGPLAIGLLALTGASAAPDFAFDPEPRWVEDPDTEVVCEAIRKECVGILKDGTIETDWNYAELYDADGMLVGVRSLGSTGCKPLDEHLLLGQRHFVQVFTKSGQPDLDAVSAELTPGTPKDAVRLVKKGTTSVSMSC